MDGQFLFLIYQEERGEEGTCHFQGYVSFNIRKHFDAVRRLMARAHWEPRRGTHQEARAYCSKEETRVAGPFIFGDDATLAVDQRGQRNDLIRVKRALDEGKSELQIAESDDTFAAWAKYFKAIERYKRLKSVRARNWPTFTTVLWGPPGTGKTRYVNDHAPGAYWVKKPIGGAAFFDGYDGQEDVVIDEFYGWLPFDLLCRMCDRYPLMVDTKGGMCNFYPKRIWITSNASPNDWYKFGLGAMARRLTEPLGRVVYCGADWTGKILACERPAHFFTSAEAEAWDAAHRSCSEELCLGFGPRNCVIAPAAIEPVIEPFLAAAPMVDDSPDFFVERRFGGQWESETLPDPDQMEFYDVDMDGRLRLSEDWLDNIEDFGLGE